MQPRMSLRLVALLPLVAAAFALLPIVTLVAASFVRNDLTGSGLRINALRSPTAASHTEFLTTVVSTGRRSESSGLTTLRRYFINTLIVCVSTVMLSLVLAVAGALVSTRSGFRGSDSMAQAALWGYVLPPVVLVAPYAHLLSLLELGGSLRGLVLAHVGFCLPLALWLSTQYFAAIPLEWDRLAELDGLGCARTIFTVLLPRASPGLAAVAAFVAVLSWNDIVLASILASEQTKTLGAGIQDAFPNETLSSNSTVAAATLWMSLPLVVAVVAAYAWVMRGTRRHWGLSL